MNTTNPLAMYGFILLAILLVGLCWRSVRDVLGRHGSPESLAKRQLLQARKDELMYAQAAEYYGAVREAARATIARLEATTTSGEPVSITPVKPE